MAKAAKKATADKQEWMYQIIQSPHVTEKATMGSANNQVTFKVPGWATKPQVKQAIEVLFGVKVKGVNTSVLKGKTKRFKGQLGQRSDLKKAMVTLEEGQTIDFGTGL